MIYRVVFFFVVAVGHSAVDAQETGATAAVTVASGSHAGTYRLSASDACVIAKFHPAKPAGFSVVLVSDSASLSIDMPNIERSDEIQIELVLAGTKRDESRKNTTNTSYVADTRPEAMLEPYQRQQRGSKGFTGKVTAKLVQQQATAQLQFSAQTAVNIQIDGSVDCSSVDQNYAE